MVVKESSQIEGRGREKKEKSDGKDMCRAGRKERDPEVSLARVK